MKSKSIPLVLLSVLLAFACSKPEEVNPLDISGTIVVFDHYPDQKADPSGVSVTLMQDYIPLVTAVTTAKGKFTFKGVPFGNYNIELQKDGYVEGWESRSFTHEEGDAASPLEYRMFAVPDYQLTLDSVDISKGRYAQVYYLRINGDTLLPDALENHLFIGYFNKTRNVNSLNQIANNEGYLADHDTINPDRTFAVRGIVYLTHVNLDKFATGDSCYLRLYPLAEGQGTMPDEFSNGALGEPSNVIGFKLED